MGMKNQPGKNVNAPRTQETNRGFERPTSNAQRRSSRIWSLAVWMPELGAVVIVIPRTQVLKFAHAPSASTMIVPFPSTLRRGPHCLLRMRNLMVPSAFGRRAGSYFKVRRWTLSVERSIGPPSTSSTLSTCSTFDNGGSRPTLRADRRLS